MTKSPELVNGDDDPSGPSIDKPRRFRLPAGRRRRGVAAVTPPPINDVNTVSCSPQVTDADRPDRSEKVTNPENTSDNDIETAADVQPDDPAETAEKRPSVLLRAFIFGVVPLTAMSLALGAGYLKYQDSKAKTDQRSGVESVQAAKESTIGILSYTPDTAQQTLTAARDRLTGTFRDSYTSLTNDVVIPGAKEKRISATAAVPAAAPLSTSANHAVVLVFVNQAILVGNNAPTQTASVVQVALDKVENHWLISGFDPK
jgi:Mce-associated membrane protein